MGDEQRQALARLFAENEAFKAAIMGATSIEDAVRVAGEYGIDATAEDFAPPEGSVSDAELEGASGGFYSFPPGSHCCPTHYCPTSPVDPACAHL